MSSFMSEQDPGVSIIRDFAASPETVYKSWITPEHFAAWWGGADVVVPIESVEIDAREGGSWKATMVLPNGHEMHWVGEYQTLTEFSRIVLTVTDDASSAERETVTCTLTPITSGTQMHVTQFGGHMDADMYAMTTQGYQSFFDVMQKLVESA